MVSDGVDEADALLHETRMVMFWFTFGWPMLMMYWLCVYIAAAVHKTHRKADDLPQRLVYPPQLLVGWCIGLLLMLYFIYAIALWVHLMFTVFGETGAMCAAADSKEVRCDTRSTPAALHGTDSIWMVGFADHAGREHRAASDWAPSLLRCHAGLNRSGLLLLAHHVPTEGWPFSGPVPILASKSFGRRDLSTVGQHKHPMFHLDALLTSWTAWATVPLAMNESATFEVGLDDRSC
eukprot:COSAG02_NODE_6460_length_3556_cov_38.164015_3_plen_236_part_00